VWKLAVFERALPGYEEIMKMLTPKRLVSRLWLLVVSVNLPFLLCVCGPRKRELGAESEMLAFRFKGRVISMKGTSPCRLGAAAGIPRYLCGAKVTAERKSRDGGKGRKTTTVAQGKLKFKHRQSIPSSSTAMADPTKVSYSDEKGTLPVSNY